VIDKPPADPVSKGAADAARRREIDVGLLEVEKRAQDALQQLDSVPEIASVGGGQAAIYLALASIMDTSGPEQTRLSAGASPKFDHGKVDTTQTGWFQERFLAAAEIAGTSREDA